MKVKYMDENLLEIAKLDNILSINSYSVFSPTDNLPLIGFEIKYIDEEGKTKTIRYFTDDEYYIPFIKQVYDYYISHENEFITDEHITLYLDNKEVKRKIDKHSKELFDDIDRTLCRDKITKVFDGSIKQEMSTFGDNTREIESHINTIIYELTKIFSLDNKEFSVSEKVNIFNNNFVIKGTINGRSITIPVYYEKLSDEEIHFSLGNIFKPGFLTMTITHSKDKISILSKCNHKKLSLFSTYSFLDNVTYTHEVYSGKNVISFNKNEIRTIKTPLTLKPYFDFINENINDYLFYSLPNGDVYAVSVTRKQNANSSQREIRKIRFTNYYGKYHIRDDYVLELNNDNILIHVNGFIVDSTMIKCGYEYLIESVFLENNTSSGEYKKDYSGKVVYRILKDDKTIELKNLEDKNIQRLYLRGNK